MINCPKCNATLPDFASQCQFCGAAFSNQNLPPKIRAAGGYVDTGKPRWVWPAYYAIAGWWVFTGVTSVFQGVVGGGLGGYFAIVGGAINLLFGLGLLARVELIRGITNVLCFINILLGLRSLAVGFFMTASPGWWGPLIMIMAIVNIAVAVLLVFLIAETDTSAPNF